MDANTNPYAYERAAFLRDAEYTKENVLDSEMQDAIVSAGTKCRDAFDNCDYSDDELDQSIEQIPTDDDQRNEEINRILQSNEDLDIDGVIGLNDEENKESEDEL